MKKANFFLLKSEGFIETERRRGTVICLPGYEEKDHQEEFQEKLEEELELLSAEAKIRGMSYKDFLDYCRQAFSRMEVAAVLRSHPVTPIRR